MKEITGDIWSYLGKAWIVIPTNTQTKKDGTAVMGKGLALQAAQRFPDLPHRYGRYLSMASEALVLENEKLILLPTKDNWRSPSTLELIKKGVEIINRWAKHPRVSIITPRLGCGNCQRDWETEVKPLMINLPDNVFVITMGE